MFAKHWVVLELVLFVSVALAVDVAPAWAQTEAVVRGQVLAAADGSALADALVTLAPGAGGESWETRSDPAGRFTFSQVRAGAYVLSASARQSHQAPARSTVLVRENAGGAIELRYRGRLMRWTEIPAPRSKPTEAPTTTRMPAAATARRVWRPGAEHPWRQDYGTIQQGVVELARRGQ